MSSDGRCGGVCVCGGGRWAKGGAGCRWVEGGGGA